MIHLAATIASGIFLACVALFLLSIVAAVVEHVVSEVYFLFTGKRY